MRDRDASPGTSRPAAIDIGLIERIAARDEYALGELYDCHSRLLYSLALRILRDAGHAEDVLQEVFLLVWTRVQTYNAALGPPVAWLVRITRNRAIDRLRTVGSRMRADDGAAAPGVTGYCSEPRGSCLVERSGGGPRHGRSTRCRRSSGGWSRTPTFSACRTPSWRLATASRSGP